MPYPKIIALEINELVSCDLGARILKMLPRGYSVFIIRKRDDKIVVYAFKDAKGHIKVDRWV